ncbi:MAG: iron ABC transporter permease [Clostridia bacterium]|nr:iron ABC transporter permease [Clostridia bacterium]
MQNDYKKIKTRFITSIIILSVLTVVLFFVSMCVGRFEIPFEDVVKYFTGQTLPEISERVITYLRLPRTLLAVLVGCALATSGALYQSVFNNKLVSPDLLGVSSGASVGACFAILLGLSGALISVFSFALGFITVILTVVVAKIFKNKSNVVLLLSGIAIGGLMSSGIGLMKYLADDEMKLAEMTYWLLGDLSGATMKEVFVMLPIVVISCVVTILMSWRVNIVSLGAKESKTLGVNYKANMGILIAIATLLTAGAVSVSGSIGWIGLVIPNVIRLIVGSDNKKVLPLSMLSGAAFMIIVDMLARTLAPNEIPLSVITGIIGTPLFIYAIFKRRKDLQ